MSILELIGLGTVLYWGLKALTALVVMVEDVKTEDRKRGMR